MSTRPDTRKVLEGLKDFQRITVDYVFERLYGSGNIRRFLVADEVGLGKTMVARGLIARVIDHLWDKSERITVVYVCSNTDIAKQNLERLRFPDCEISTPRATRLTLLPLELRRPGKRGVNFLALTPNTSFYQSGGGGRVEERVLLHWLLDRAWDIGSSKAARLVMCNFAGINRFERDLENFNPDAVNKDLAAAFIRRLQESCEKDRRENRSDLRARFEDLRLAFHRSNAVVCDEDFRNRSVWLGDLRRLLAEVCLSALEPDLIILDEFQRFRALMEAESDAGELARNLFESDAGNGARALLLSATPYRSLSLHHEKDENHYGDFLKLIEFLENGNGCELKRILSEYRDAIPSMRTQEGLQRLRLAKRDLEDRLRRVMARTERLAVVGEIGQMLMNVPPDRISLRASDLKAYLGAQSIAEHLKWGDILEYWKSGEYLFNFMDAYKLKSSFTENIQDREMIMAVREHPHAFLDLEKIRKYEAVESTNSRLRVLMDETVDRGMWRLLWLPPTMPYYRLAGPFADPKLANVTKRLVFSAWHMVPKMVATLVSYEAERRMMRCSRRRRNPTYESWAKRAKLLRADITEGRNTGMPLFLLVYPCLVFARDFDPKDLALSGLLSSKEVLSAFSARLREMTKRLPVKPGTGGPVDESWYWIVPMLLDQIVFSKESTAWWKQDGLLSLFSGKKAGKGDTAWPRHLESARDALDLASKGELDLGPQPSDLFDVLALAASAGPGSVALRSYSRICRYRNLGSLGLRNASAKTGRAFLALFNHAEVIEMVRKEFSGGEPYWLRVLEYSHAGCLQSMLDEYSHILRESLGVADQEPEEMAGRISLEVIGAVTLRAASLRLDEVTAPPYARRVVIVKQSMRIRFAMRFGDERNDEEEPGGDEEDGLARTRKERVRSAFNSPFWPFVLVTTSVGQEGLDFHNYCHAITHWNLPANPIDLEQREGRINRYKGHAIRKNVASSFAARALEERGGDAWEKLFAIARSECDPCQNELVPYWVYPGEAKIERHVPSLPFSREEERLARLIEALTVYRMVFGQNRQEDLINYILTEIPESERDALAKEFLIDLQPPRGGRDWPNP